MLPVHETEVIPVGVVPLGSRALEGLPLLLSQVLLLSSLGSGIDHQD
jgi:hypothetical protein